MSYKTDEASKKFGRFGTGALSMMVAEDGAGGAVSVKLRGLTVNALELRGAGWSNGRATLRGSTNNVLVTLELAGGAGQASVNGFLRVNLGPSEIVNAPVTMRTTIPAAPDAPAAAAPAVWDLDGDGRFTMDDVRAFADRHPIVSAAGIGAAAWKIGKMIMKRGR